MPNLKNPFSASRLAGLAAIAAFTLLRFWDPAPLEIARNLFFDVLHSVHPRPVQDYPVIIADIDDKSLNEIGQWPWPRTALAKLIGRLSEDGAAVIGFDIIFPESDRLSPRRLADLVQPGDDDLKQRLAALADNDELFAKAIKGARVVLGRTALMKAGDSAFPANKTAPKVSIATIGSDPRNDLLRYPAALKNLRLFR